MAKTPVSDADRRLEEVLAERGLADPRPALRERLRMLRETDPAAFEQARTRFDSMVSESDAGRGGDVLDGWIEYGRLLGELTGEGRVVHVDATGRALQPGSPPAAGTLVLHLPRDAATPALLVLSPAQPSAAQRATVDLLVGRKLAL